MICNEQSLGDGFLIIQCAECPNIFTHSGYLLRGSAFTYAQELVVDPNNSELLCSCGNKVGIKQNEVFLLCNDAIQVNKFPELTISSCAQYEKGIQSCLKAADDIDDKVYEIKQSFEERIIEIEKRLN